LDAAGINRMATRLIDLYQPNDLVEITFKDSDQWIAAIVLRHEPPGIWVVMSDGSRWFVTNTRRVRPHPSLSSAASPPVN